MVVGDWGVASRCQTHTARGQVVAVVQVVIDSLRGAWCVVVLKDGRVSGQVAQLDRQLSLKLSGRGPTAGRASPLPEVTEWVPTGAAAVGTCAAVLAPRQCESVGFATPRRTTAVLRAKPVHIDLVTVSSGGLESRSGAPVRVSAPAHEPQVECSTGVRL